MPSTRSKKGITGVQVSREEFLKAKPVRHPDLKWEEDKKGLHVRVPRKQTRFFRAFSKLLPLTRERRVLLDKQGALVLRLCDGDHQIREIAKELSEQFNLQVSDAEAALNLYFIQMSQNGLVGFVFPESARKRYHRTLDRTEKQAKKD